ncbi:hypothetical protein I6J42_33580 [Streptomyces californicus]|uniref:Integral membrane protein n=1 Tax=Streptomyces californicus TaxID=67351 RepID=A0ABD7CQY6_9ACTN|nr:MULTISPECIES: hypothetical protein [Streptomyces]QRV31812.1 hypothetical protein I6J39_34005 [Streptomyces californicus]QRV32579.1 hypothetical protein I6J42_00075 [Streptomyces californicus]QRV38469.1 hypothetical protein I6J42_33580 [Streptomyces californicus]QRV45228.1 hypothetical protein I6J41_33945 [Streptomyces californicus]QRV46017.1 hypothetical protein I6J43_00040 [Streptomyces californicus]
MSGTRNPEGGTPEGQPDPAQSGAEPQDPANRPESVGRSFLVGLAEGAGRVVGSTLASVVIIGLVTGGVIAIQQESPGRVGGALCTLL